MQYKNGSPKPPKSQQDKPKPISTDVSADKTAAETAEPNGKAAGCNLNPGLLVRVEDIDLTRSLPSLTSKNQSVDRGKAGDPMTPVSMKVEKSCDVLTLSRSRFEEHQTKDIKTEVSNPKAYEEADIVSNHTGLGSSVDMRQPTGYTLDVDPCTKPDDETQTTDIRGSIGPAHDIQLSIDGKMFKQAWTHDPDLALSSESYVVETVQAWQASVQPARNIDFKQLTLELINRPDCDFDPAELKFRSPMKPGETKERSDNPRNMDEKRNRKKKALIQRRIKEDRVRVPAAPREVLPQEAFEPTFACHMRPAAEGDLTSIKEIYDLEVTEGFQARDRIKLPSSSYVSLLKMCEERLLPFIVTVAGAPHDVRNGRVPEVAWHSKEPPKGTVLGFSFFSPYHRGFCNDLSSAGDSSVRIDTMVHPDYRARFIGTALIDKMLQLVCPGYRYMDTCQFVDDSAVPLYRGAHTSLHFFHHIYTDVLVDGDQDPNAKRYDKLLKDRFGFEKLSVIHGSHQHKNGMLDLVSYHKQCRPVCGPDR